MEFSSRPPDRVQTQISYIPGRFFTIWATILSYSWHWRKTFQLFTFKNDVIISSFRYNVKLFTWDPCFLLNVLLWTSLLELLFLYTLTFGMLQFCLRLFQDSFHFSLYIFLALLVFQEGAVWFFTSLWIFQSSVYAWKKKMCILLLSGWFCKYLLDEFGVKYSSNPLFPYWFCVWMIYSSLNVGYWSALLLHCYVFLTSDMLIII